MIPHITVQNLNVYYGQNHILKEINLEIPRQKITAIMGPSGCGKTTLLKSLNRFIELIEGAKISGQVLLGDQNIYQRDVELTEVRKRMGLLAQKPHPLPMSIYANVAYGMLIHHLVPNQKAMRSAVQHYLEIAGLWDEVKNRLNEPANSLSLGQQQRLCLARGLAVEPEVILGDEPTSALDPISSQHIESRLTDLKETYTTIIVTHTLRQAKRLADHVIFMYLGEVVESGPAVQVFEHPKEERTLRYLQGQF